MTMAQFMPNAFKYEMHQIFSFIFVSFLLLHDISNISWRRMNFELLLGKREKFVSYCYAICLDLCLHKRAEELIEDSKKVNVKLTDS